MNFFFWKNCPHHGTNRSSQQQFDQWRLFQRNEWKRVNKGVIVRLESESDWCCPLDEQHNSSALHPQLKLIKSTPSTRIHFFGVLQLNDWLIKDGCYGRRTTPGCSETRKYANLKFLLIDGWQAAPSNNGLRLIESGHQGAVDGGGVGDEPIWIVEKLF